MVSIWAFFNYTKLIDHISTAFIRDNLIADKIYQISDVIIIMLILLIKIMISVIITSQIIWSNFVLYIYIYIYIYIYVYFISPFIIDWEVGGARVIPAVTSRARAPPAFRVGAWVCQSAFRYVTVIKRSTVDATASEEVLGRLRKWVSELEKRLYYIHSRCSLKHNFESVFPSDSDGLIYLRTDARI